MPKEKGGKKNQAETVERITEQKVLPIIERYGYELWDVIFEKEGAMWYLKVLFDKADGGIDDAECEEITEPLNKAVDTLSCIDLVDVFEVGSPGLDRQLRKPFHFVKMKGEKIKVTVRDENGKTAYYSGVLGDYDENSGEFTVQTDDGAIDTFRTENAQDLTAGGMEYGDYVCVTFHPSKSKSSNIYTAIKVQDA
mgnify:FL=1